MHLYVGIRREVHVSVQEYGNRIVTMAGLKSLCSARSVPIHECLLSIVTEIIVLNPSHNIYISI